MTDHEPIDSPISEAPRPDYNPDFRAARRPNPQPHGPRQIARTGKTPLPQRVRDINGRILVYAFAIRIDDSSDAQARALTVQCPFCGETHQHPVPYELKLHEAAAVLSACAQGRYYLTVPTGTPVYA